MLTITPIPAFTDNYIWMLFDANRSAAKEGGATKCLVVDPGDPVPVERAIAAHSLELAAILITHHHADHTGGIAALTRHRDIPVFGPAAEKISGVNRPLREGDVVNIPDVLVDSLRVIEVPGHTLGHVAYVGEDYVFCGDTLFAAGCGRLFEGTPAQMYESLQKLSRLPGATRVFCTHEYTLANLRFASVLEPSNAALLRRCVDEQSKRDLGQPTLPSTIALETETNPFLRSHSAEIARAAQATNAQRSR
jgi:hydroxyacylglutathione hydrolase